MKQIHFFGCSFTKLEDSSTGYTFTNFRNLINQKIENVNCYNHSISGNSNAQIVNDVYWQSKNITNPKETIFVIQTTFLNRLGLYYDLMNRFESICKTENADNEIEKIFIDFYNNWLKYFYNKEHSLLEFQKQFDILCSYLNELKIKYILIGMDEYIDLINDSNFFTKNNFLKFENLFSYYQYCKNNKLRIYDIIGKIELIPEDYHFNQLGHEILADKIIEKLNQISND